MGCPACGEALIVYELEGIEVDCCAVCAGVWLDRGELGAIAQLAGGLDHALEQRLGAAAARPDTARAKRRCPRCGRALEPILLAGDAPLELDRCPQGDGLWFDSGELHAVIAPSAESEGPVAQFLRAMFRYHPSAGEGSANS